MANIMSSMKIPIQKLVSKKKKRYTQDGFNLDLTYILPNLIAMGFPANKIEGVYRNHIDEVEKFFESKHFNNYRIYNLCSERRYDIKKFHSRVATFPFHDHNPPTIELIQAFCDDVHEWLTSDSAHIAAVHCKAGKGRTGTMICCYMLRNRIFNNASDALMHYGEKRTHDQKGVTIPSQRRYVEYYSHLLNSGQPYSRIPLQICEIKLLSPPILKDHQGPMHFSISYANVTDPKDIYTAEVPDVKKSTNSEGQLVIGLDRCIALAGDIKVEFYCKAKVMRKKSILFRFWFNTFFVNQLHADDDSSNPCLEYVLTKSELDTAHKDKLSKLYSPEFKVQVTLQRTPSGSYVNGIMDIQNHHRNMSITIPDAHTPSESPEASSSGSSTGEDWESGEFVIERPKQRKIKNVKTNVIATTKQAQQFKAKSSHIKITGNSNSLKKRLTNMRSEPDFCEALAQNVNLLRPTRQAVDSVENDYYSQMCDNQLSVGSPCSQFLRSPDDWRSSCKVLVVAKPVESQSIGFKVDDKNVRIIASKKLPTTHTRHNLQSVDEPPMINVAQSSSLPMHSHFASITAQSVDSVAPSSTYSPLCSEIVGEHSSGSDGGGIDVHGHHIPMVMKPKLDEVVATMASQTADSTSTRNKPKQSVSQTSLKQRIFSKSTLSQTKSKFKTAQPSTALSTDISADGVDAATGDHTVTGRISNNNNNNTSNKRFTFRDFRQELQSVIRQNSSSKSTNNNFK